MEDIQNPNFELKEVLESEPIKVGHSKQLYAIDEHHCLALRVGSPTPVPEGSVWDENERDKLSVIGLQF